ncbi:hypothetical protein B0T11DRAFT_60002 [Plectosphaerella cucumerina]|uniref:Uncharacterized protein n=1 Tax=Plectosphaerella cucumerina TaxID=40658 RepID=A0A8K0TRD1_9PEZI|nr:hypothetical protein B0T11DRAFT_60002 [Plectosphaerella cucumerina]
MHWLSRAAPAWHQRLESRRARLPTTARWHKWILSHGIPPGAWLTLTRQGQPAEHHGRVSQPNTTAKTSVRRANPFDDFNIKTHFQYITSVIYTTARISGFGHTTAKAACTALGSDSLVRSRMVAFSASHIQGVRRGILHGPMAAWRGEDD